MRISPQKKYMAMFVTVFCYFLIRKLELVLNMYKTGENSMGVESLFISSLVGIFLSDLK